MSSPVIVERVRPPGSQLTPWQRVRAVRKGDVGELGVLARHHVLRAGLERRRRLWRILRASAHRWSASESCWTTSAGSPPAISHCVGDRRRAAEQSGDLACTQGWHEHDASSLHLHAYMMHLVDSGWMPIREAKHEVLAVTARTPIEPRAPGSLRASRVAGANGASQHLARRTPGPAGSASSSIAVVTANGGAVTGPTSGGVTVS